MDEYADDLLRRLTRVLMTGVDYVEQVVTMLHLYEIPYRESGIDARPEGPVDKAFISAMEKRGCVIIDSRPANFEFRVRLYSGLDRGQ